MATVLRGGPNGVDTTVSTTGSGPDIFVDHGDGYITIYTLVAVEGSNNIFSPMRREPKAIGVTYATDLLDSGG